MPGDEGSVTSSETSSSEEGWVDANSDGEQEAVAVISLLDDRVFPDAMSMLSYCKEKHQLDFLAIRDKLGLDFYGTVRLINFIRQRAHEGAPLPQEISAADIEDESYLRPVLDDDALILCLDDLPPAPSAQTQPSAQVAPAGEATSSEAASANRLLERNAELQAELESLTRRFENYRLAVQQTLDKRWGDDVEPDNSKKPATSSKDGGESAEDNKFYFESYSHNDIHEIMLKDTVRTNAYRDFIYDNKHLFAGKVVLDIGCGTGILSMFCAKAGAKQVIAVDRSDIIDRARENVFHNGLGDKITCLKGLVEEVVLPVDKVDIIVSEWMGYALLYEAMLPSVLWARDRYLRPDGLLVPSHATLWLAPLSDPEYVEEHVAFWRNVYGFDMRAMQAGIHADVRIQAMPETSVCGRPSMFRFLDLHRVAKEELVFTAPWDTVLSDDAGPLDGFLLWFDIYFAKSQGEEIVPRTASATQWAEGRSDRVAFSTGPFTKDTHWKQTILLFDDTHSAPAAPSRARELSGEITFEAPDNNARALDIRVSWNGDADKKEAQTWALR